jgi:hypothetical protein
MRKVFIIMALMALSAGLFAKAGLLGIWYGQSSNAVTKQLLKQGFCSVDEKPQSRTFVTDKATDIMKVEVFMSPKQKLTGWKVYFKPALAEDKFYSILNECIKLHGKEYKMNANANIIGWNLDESKNFLLGFDDDQTLQFGSYIDSRFPDTMQLN